VINKIQIKKIVRKNSIAQSISELETKLFGLKNSIHTSYRPPLIIGYNSFTTDLILSENEITFNNEIFGIWISMVLLNVYAPTELSRAS
jgi:hypothetical protein